MAADRSAAWTSDAVLGDGSTVHIRPIRTTDADALVALHGRFSERTRYRRYFGAYPRIPDRDLQRFVTVDMQQRVALVAELGDDLIAVGRFDRLVGDRDEAEIAFVVEDAHQGRGVGALLMEHLAAIGRELGVRQFVAEILPDNRTMMRLFLDAGYSAQHAYADGVVRMTFPIAETPESVQVMQRREHRTEARSVDRLLAPRSVVVVGASAREGSLGRAVLASVLGGGFTGAVSVVSPSGSGVGEIPGYRSVRDVPDPVDVAVLAVPADAVPGVVDDCAEARVHGLVVLSAGFAESGPEGAAAQRDLVATARGRGMRVLGPNALGLVNTDPAVRLNATFAPVVPEPGPVGFFCQSGALGVATLSAMTARGLGLSSFVSAGNRADVSGNDLLQYWQDDPRTRVVLMHLETFGNPRKFSRLARRLARQKPVVAVKSGAADGQLSAEAVRALFAASGVIRARTVPEMMDVAALLAYQPLPVGERVGVVTNSAALGVLATDALAEAGLPLAARGVTDVGATAPQARFADALCAAVEDSDVHAVVAVFVPPIAVGLPRADDAFAGLSGCPAKPVVSTVYGLGGLMAEGRMLAGAVPSYPSPEQAVQALAAVCSYARWRRRPAGSVSVVSHVDSDRARAVIEGVLVDASSVQLDQDRTRSLLDAYGIAVQRSRTATTAEQAVHAARELGYPVALKSRRESLRHRVDLGGVRLDLADDADVRGAFEQVAARSGGGPVLLQPMAAPGVPVLVTMTEDESFGALAGLAVAGVPAELLDDVAYRPLPLTDTDLHDLVRAPRAAPLLFGYHGAEPVDTAALEDLLARVSLLADDLPEVAELRLDPVLVAAEGVRALAAEVVLRPAGQRPDTGPRRLR